MICSFLSLVLVYAQNSFTTNPQFVIWFGPSMKPSSDTIIE